MSLIRVGGSCAGGSSRIPCRVAEEMSFDYREPTSIREAVELGARFGAESRFLAGGTDLMIQIHRGRCAPRQVVSLHRVPGLDAIDVDGTVARRAGHASPPRTRACFPGC